MAQQQYKVQFKTIQQIKPDSPKTQLACQQLGLQLEQDIRAPESFGGPGVTEEIQQIRYEHYLNRLHQKAVEVLQRRKEIIQRNKSQPSYDTRGSQIMNVHLEKMPQEIKASVGQLSAKSKQTAIQMFKITSRDSPNVKIFQELLPVPGSQNQTQEIKSRSIIDQTQDSASGLVYKGLLEREVNSFNRLKLQNLREAQIQINQDKERINLIDKLRIHDQRVIETTIGQQMQKIEQQITQHKVREEKIKVIKETQRDFRKQKLIEIERINLKLEKIRRRIQNENEVKDKINDEKLSREQIKKQKVETRRLEVSQEMMEKMDDIMKEIKYKQDETSQRYQDLMKNKQMNLRESTEKASLINQQATEKLRSDLQSRSINRAAQKMMKGQSNIEKLLLDQIAIQSIRKSKIMHENQKISEIQTKKYLSEKQRISNIEKDSDKKAENMKSQKMFTQHNLLLKQEQRRLKQEDIQENYDRQRRLKENNINEMMLKGQMVKDKKTLTAIQNDLIQRASMEKLEQENQERERVWESVRNKKNNLDRNLAFYKI